MLVRWAGKIIFHFYAIKSCQIQILSIIYQVNQEMAVRIKEAIKIAKSIEELVELVATKRYTKARVRRLLTYILVQARESDLPEAIHVLGFTEKVDNILKLSRSRSISSAVSVKNPGMLWPKSRPDLPTGKSKYSRAEFWKSAD